MAGFMELGTLANDAQAPTYSQIDARTPTP